MEFIKVARILAPVLVLSLVPVSFGAAKELEERFPTKQNIEETTSINSLSTQVEEEDDYVIIELEASVSEDEISNNATTISISNNNVDISVSSNEEQQEGDDEETIVNEVSYEEKKTTKKKEDKVVTDESPAIEEPVVEASVKTEEIVSTETEASYAYEEVGYASSGETEVLAETSETSEVIDTISYQDVVEYTQVDEDWIAVETDEGEVGYVASEDVTDQLIQPTNYVQVYGDKRKSWENYKAITGGKQYQLQKIATTGSDGGRMINGRYLIATGSAISHNIGQYVDVVLANGITIPCIIGDAKANVHTDAGNMVGLDGSVVEFIVDKSSLSSTSRQQGNMDFANFGWDSRVIGAVILDERL